MFDDDDYTPGQHAIFIEFVSLCDKLLDDTLTNLGCDAETFVKVLGEPEMQTSPRVISVIDSLKSMDDGGRWRAGTGAGEG